MAHTSQIPQIASSSSKIDLMSAQTSSLSSTTAVSIGDTSKKPLAWAGVRHQMAELGKEAEKQDNEQYGTVSCQHAVFMTCLNLAHELNLREVGQYAWVQPVFKDAHGSMLRIMKSYTNNLQLLEGSFKIAIRSAPDPSKQIIQHHLLRSRQLAGPDNYVLAIYTGHGIQEPPTEAGELWCYDKSFEECSLDGSSPSEYIPMMLFDVLSWAGSSSCFVWDVKHAGRFITATQQEAEEIDSQLRAAALKNPEVGIAHPANYSRNQIHFAACGANQVLPVFPGMPDDLFTACLLTPLRIALLYHNLQTFPLNSLDTSVQRSASYMETLWKVLSPAIKQRLLSELNSILKTIAWKVLDSSIYRQIFGQQGQIIPNIAAGFMLAQRVLGSCNVTPISLPVIPASNSHPLWTNWDLVMENLFEQLPSDLNEGNWEQDLQMLSFMKDQINTTLNASSKYSDDALAKLPIILQAAKTTQLRAKACTALDGCLQDLDLRLLAKAVDCGVLEVALELLNADDPAIATQVISIWASLIRHEGAIKELAAPVSKAEYLTDVPHVLFLLNHLEDGLQSGPAIVSDKIIECAAVLCTILGQIPRRQAPRFLRRSLELVVEMLSQQVSLIQQWGALFFAELMSGINADQAQVESLLQSIQDQILSLVNDSAVETRAAMLYALTYWLRCPTTSDIVDLEHPIQLLGILIPQVHADAAIQVRKELCNLLNAVLVAAGQWSTVAYWASMCQRAVKEQPGLKDDLLNQTTKISRHYEMTPEKYNLVLVLVRAVAALRRYSHDPDPKVARWSKNTLERVKPPYIDAAADFGQVDQVLLLLESGTKICEARSDVTPSDLAQSNHDLFRFSKLSLRAYLLSHKDTNTAFQGLAANVKQKPDTMWAMRHRKLEDSMVVAEQQAGLPWKWLMKDIAHPDPWSSLTFHSFDSMVLSANGTNQLMVWDWSSARKKGVLTLPLPPNTKIKSGRFVNELHDNNVILAECNDGTIHVFSGPPHEPERMTAISSFSALDLEAHGLMLSSKEHKRLRTSWWRVSGLLAVGGSSRYINLWDCPAEQRLRYFETQESTPVTTLITEPKSGNIIVAGFGSGVVKLYDLRQARNTAVLQYQGDANSDGDSQAGIKKLGIFLGESSNITSAAANGMINIHDLRRLDSPTSSVVAQPGGICKANFQAHSGLMSTVGNLEYILQGGQALPAVNWSLHRSTLSTVTRVTQETIHFPKQAPDVAERDIKPYTVLHPLRPFLGVGYGRNCHLRGSGVGEGDTTDSGSYSFLQAQAKHML